MVKPHVQLVLVSSMHSLHLHTQPINVVVLNGTLAGLNPEGDLVLKGASRLDAFSGYPVRT